jgi:S-(hydroxymethyl)glutathione dehydrogenase / alcohol dehydrogenase
MKFIKSEAAILRNLNKPLDITNIFVPTKLLEGQVLVRMIYSGICGSQLGEIKGIKGKDKFLPHLLGHEGIAEVIKVGRKVIKVKKNDNILLHWMPSDGINSQTPIYFDKNKNLINAGHVTTFNEYAIISENRLTKIEKEKKNFLNYLLLGCTSSTAIGSVNKNLEQISKHTTVIVSGCGAIGIYIIKYLKFLGVKKIIGIDLDKKKINFAKKSGCLKVFNVLSQDFKNKIKLYCKNGADLIYECSGNANQISYMFQILNISGTLNLIGVPKIGTKSCFNTLEINLGKKIVGNKGGDFYAKKHIKDYKKIIFSKKCDHKGFITEKIQLHDLNKYFERMSKGKTVGKGVITFK